MHCVQLLLAVEPIFPVILLTNMRTQLVQTKEVSNLCSAINN